MKNIQKIRFGVQLLCLVLTVIGFFTSFSMVSGIIFVSGILGGVFFCGWMCPFGTLQELFSRFGELLGVRKIKMPQRLQKGMFFLRYMVFAVAMLVTADIVFQVLSFDPRTNLLQMLSSKGISLLAATVIIAFALLSMLFERPFCNYLCIEGAKYGLMSTLRPLTIIRDTEKCVGCNKCTKACPMNIDVAKCEQMHSPQCINCMKCLSECPIEDTLKYGVRRFDRKQIRKYVVIVSLLAFSVLAVFASGIADDEHEHRGKANASTQEAVQSNTVSSEISKNPTVGSVVDGYSDGTFEGTGIGFNGDMKVEVIIEGGIIAKVEVLENVDDRKWFNRANNVIPNKIIENQSANVDVVGGATYSSQGIIDGVGDALAKAKE